jgi:tetratricopeptide (TPR) repeat protein
VQTAHRVLGHYAAADYDAARVSVVEAYVLRSMEEVGPALDDVRKSAATFRLYGDTAKASIASFAYAAVLMKANQYRDALDVFEQLLAVSQPFFITAQLHLSIGVCHRELRQFEPALRHYQIALDAFESSGSTSSAVRVRWNIAGVLLLAGRTRDAYPRLQAVRESLVSLGMHEEAALAGLEVVEILLIEERHAEVEQICREVVSYFETAGVPYGRHALTALAYMRDAAAARKATVELVREVRQYVSRLPKQPNLLFAYAPH